MVDARRPPVALVGGGRHGEPERPERRSRAPSRKTASCPYAPACMICAMAYRAAVVGASGYTGAEALRLLAGHPEIEVVHLTAASNAGARVCDLFPSLTPVYGDAVLAPLDVADLARPRPRLLHAAARREPRLPARSPRRRRPRDRSRRRLPPPGRRVRTLVRRDAPRARRRSNRFAYGLVELYRDDIAHARARGRARVLPDRGQPRVRAVARTGSRRAPRHRRRSVGCLRRGPRAEDHEPVLGGERERLRVRAADASPHRGDGAGAVQGRAATGCGALHAASRARRRAASSRRVTRGRRRRVFRRRGSSSTTASSMRTIRASWSSTSRRGPRRRTAPTSLHVTVRFDERTDTVVAIAAEDNLVKGASGQMIQAANLLLGLPETTGLPLLGIQP